VNFIRIIQIIIKPHTVWHDIKEDEDTFAHVLTHYALPLAVLPAVFGFFGQVIIGLPSSFSTVVYRVPVGLAFVRMILYYVLLLIGLYIAGIIINGLSSSFQSRHDAGHAYKLAVFSYVPAFLAGTLKLFPVLGLLTFLLSLYSIYVLYKGIPVMMDTPAKKVASYTIVVTIIVVILYAMLAGISSIILGPIWQAS
jgi:hypothetical protein